MEPEPLADVVADASFDSLIKQGGIGQNVLFTQVALKEEHFIEMT